MCNEQNLHSPITNTYKSQFSLYENIYFILQEAVMSGIENEQLSFAQLALTVNNYVY